MFAVTGLSTIAKSDFDQKRKYARKTKGNFGQRVVPFSQDKNCQIIHYLFINISIMWAEI